MVALNILNASVDVAKIFPTVNCGVPVAKKAVPALLVPISTPPAVIDVFNSTGVMVVPRVAVRAVPE